MKYGPIVSQKPNILRDNVKKGNVKKGCNSEKSPIHSYKTLDNAGKINQNTKFGILHRSKNALYVYILYAEYFKVHMSN